MKNILRAIEINMFICVFIVFYFYRDTLILIIVIYVCAGDCSLLFFVSFRKEMYVLSILKWGDF